MLTSKEPIRLWIDTDTSGLFWSGLDCDDDLAVLAALSLHKRQILHLDGISICGGNAPLSHTWQDIHALWEHADGFQITNVQPVKGYGWRSMQVAVGWLRWYNKIRQDGMDSEDASTAIIERSRDKSLDPAHILMLGPPTNLAKAIDSGLLDQAGVSHVYLMGGELTQQTLDLNFRTDRASARTIIESNIPTTIIPIQTCAQTIVTKSYLERLDCPSMAACAILPKMNQQIKLMPRFVNQAVKKRCSLGEDYGPWIVLLSSPSKTTTMPPNEETLLTAARRPSVVMIQQEEQIQVPAGFNLLRKMMEWAPLWCFLLIDNVTYAYTAAFGVAAFDMLFLSFVQYKMGKLQECESLKVLIVLSLRSNTHNTFRTRAKTFGCYFSLCVRIANNSGMDLPGKCRDDRIIFRHRSKHWAGAWFLYFMATWTPGRKRISSG
eukprot:scaffold243_cov140-Skeletonema_menzelii.AAC.2